MATKLDEPQSEIDKGYNSGNGAYNPVELSDAENSAFGDIANNYNKTADGTKEDNAIAKANEAEKTPSQSYTNNFTGNKNGSKGSPKGYLKLAKKFGPAGGVVGIITGLGMLGLSFTPAALLVNLKENLVQRFDLQNTSMTIRTNKLIASKLAGDTTSGSCSYVEVMCRYTRPSNRLLTQLEKEGIVAKDIAGNPIDKKPLFLNEKPATYDFTDSAGKKISVKAADFKNALADNDGVRSAFHKAYNPRFVGYADTIFNKVMARFGFKKNSDVSKATSAKAAEEAIVTDTASPSNTVSEANSVSPTAANNEAEKILEEEVIAEGKAAESKVKGKSDAIQMGAMATCLALDAPGIITKVVRTYQMAQVIKYGVMFLSVADAIKAGDATPESVAALGTLLTDVFKDNKGNITNNSAMNSFSIDLALTGSVRTSGRTQDYRKTVPGYSIASLGAVTSVTSSPQVKATCNAINSTEAGAALTAAEAALGPETIGLVPILAKVGGFVFSQVASSKIISYATEKIAPYVIKMLPIATITSMLLGDITKNLQGENVGDALVSGVTNMMSQTANAGGNAPLTIPQALVYQKTTDQVNLAYAKEDQATLSPLDVSSPNTFLGSIATQMLPYFSSLTNISGAFTSFGSIFSQSISLISGNASAASDANMQTALTMCPDKSLTNSGVAVGPHCNVYYGVPPEYLNEDPVTVLTNLGDQIDPKTGDPVDGSHLSDWLNNCMAGDSLSVGECVITDQTTAEYSLYSIDHRIQISMDNDPSAGTTTTATASTTQAVGTPDNVTPKGSGWTLTDKLDYSAIACAPGTTDAGLYTHPTRGFTIRKCAVAGGFVASIVSQKVVDMFTAAKTSGVNFTLSSGFRSYEEQLKLFNQNCHQSSGSCSPPTAAPGNSQHEAGIALDLMYNGTTICFSGHLSGANCHGNGGYDWLKANAGTYGFYNLPTEAWHWSASGS